MQTKNRSLVYWSFYMLGFAVVAFLIVFTFLDSFVNSFSTGVQRALLIALIVIPTGIGTIAGIGSFFRSPRRILLSILAVLLNGLTFLYFAFLASFAG